jgi:hypothetical protein
VLQVKESWITLDLGVYSWLTGGYRLTFLRNPLSSKARPFPLLKNPERKRRLLDSLIQKRALVRVAPMYLHQQLANMFTEPPMLTMGQIFKAFAITRVTIIRKVAEVRVKTVHKPILFNYTCSVFILTKAKLNTSK